MRHLTSSEILEGSVRIKVEKCSNCTRLERRVSELEGKIAGNGTRRTRPAIDADIENLIRRGKESGDIAKLLGCGVMKVAGVRARMTRQQRIKSVR